MRKSCLALAMSAFLALPLFAQQKSSGTNDGNMGTAVAKSAPASSASKNFSVVRMNGMFALSAAPRPTPFPGPAAATEDTRPPGRLVPRYEIAGMFDYINFAPGDPFANFNSLGGSASFTYNASKWLGLTAEVGEHRFKRNIFPLTGNNTPASDSLTTYLFGPRLNLRKFDHFVPFAEFLAGGTYGGNQLTGLSGGQGQNAFAIAAGGGVDVVLTKNLAWRFAQFDYLMTTHSGPALGASGRQNNFRAATGLVLRFGIPNPPPPPNHSPVAACSVDPASVYAGSGGTVTVHVNASDPDNDSLTYSYSATGGSVEGTGPEARWSSTGAAVGSYTVNVKVDDGKGGTASCSADIRVEEKPNHPPTASLSVERSPILPGERTGVTCNGSDPDNDPLTYSYTTTGGQIVGSGSNVQFDSTGLQPGSYTVNCSVNDGRGASADASGKVEVKEPPQIKQLIEADPDLNPAEKQKILKNLLTVRLANNRRVDVTLSTTGEQSVRRFPFSSKDALTLLSRGSGETPKKKTATPAPAKKAKP